MHLSDTFWSISTPLCVCRTSAPSAVRVYFFALALLVAINRVKRNANRIIVPLLGRVRRDNRPAVSPREFFEQKIQPRLLHSSGAGKSSSTPESPPLGRAQ